MFSSIWNAVKFFTQMWGLEHYITNKPVLKITKMPLWRYIQVYLFQKFTSDPASRINYNSSWKFNCLCRGQPYNGLGHKKYDKKIFRDLIYNTNGGPRARPNFVLLAVIWVLLANATRVVSKVRLKGFDKAIFQYFDI